MKQFVVVVLLAFMAQTFAEENDPIIFFGDADIPDKQNDPIIFFGDEVPARHPYVQCKIDLYDCMRKGQQGKVECMKAYYTCMKQLLPTTPPFVIQCKDNLQACLDSSSTLTSKGKCFIAFSKCLINKGPVSGTDAPATYMLDEVDNPRHPYVQCKIDLYDCIRLKKKDKLECMKDYKSCMAVLVPTIPPFMIACKDELKTCVGSADGLVAKAACFKEFGYCLINKGPRVPVFDVGSYMLDAIEGTPVPTRHPYIQCKIDMYKCFKEGKPKLECMKTYKNCMAQLIPTIPPFVLQCRDELKKCTAAADGWRAKIQCAVDFGKCLKNKGSV